MLWGIEEEVGRRDHGEGQEDEIRNTGRSWNEVKRIAGDRNASWVPYAPQGVKGLDDENTLVRKFNKH